MLKLGFLVRSIPNNTFFHSRALCCKSYRDKCCSLIPTGLNQIAISSWLHWFSWFPLRPIPAKPASIFCGRHRAVSFRFSQTLGDGWRMTHSWKNSWLARRLTIKHFKCTRHYHDSHMTITVSKEGTKKGTPKWRPFLLLVKMLI